MNAFWTTATKTAIFLAIILLLSAAVAVLATDSSGPGGVNYGDYDDSYAFQDDLQDFGENLTVYDANVQAAPASARTIGRGSGRVTGSRSGVQDLITANGLVQGLRRIVRAGRSMDVLRNQSNPVLRRRCYEGMRKLQSEAMSIRKRRKNLAIRASAESVSLNKVFNNIMRCVSCDGNAGQFCSIAQKDLDIFTRSLGLN